MFRGRDPNKENRLRMINMENNQGESIKIQHEIDRCNQRLKELKASLKVFEDQKKLKKSDRIERKNLENKIEENEAYLRSFQKQLININKPSNKELQFAASIENQLLMREIRKQKKKLEEVEAALKVLEKKDEKDLTGDELIKRDKSRESKAALEKDIADKDQQLKALTTQPQAALAPSQGNTKYQGFFNKSSIQPSAVSNGEIEIQPTKKIQTEKATPKLSPERMECIKKVFKDGYKIDTTNPYNPFVTQKNAAFRKETRIHFPRDNKVKVTNGTVQTYADVADYAKKAFGNDVIININSANNLEVMVQAFRNANVIFKSNDPEIQADINKIIKKLEDTCTINQVLLGSKS